MVAEFSAVSVLLVVVVVLDILCVSVVVVAIVFLVVVACDLSVRPCVRQSVGAEWLKGDVLSCVDSGPAGLPAAVARVAAAAAAAADDDDDEGQLAAAAMDARRRQSRSVNAVSRSRISPGARLAAQSRLRVLHGGLRHLSQPRHLGQVTTSGSSRSRRRPTAAPSASKLM